jgi:hypothetical protein
MAAHKFTLGELHQRFESMASVAGARAAIGIRDPEVAAYGRALEYGSLAGQRPWPAPGPRTTLAVDPETGARVVLSAQAPQGFVRVQAAAFADAVSHGLKVPKDWLNAGAAQSCIADAIQRAAQDVLQRLQEVVPKDSGRLAENLQVLDL